MAHRLPVNRETSIHALEVGPFKLPYLGTAQECLGYGCMAFYDTTTYSESAGLTVMEMEVPIYLSVCFRLRKPFNSELFMA